MSKGKEMPIFGGLQPIGSCVLSYFMGVFVNEAEVMHTFESHSQFSSLPQWQI